MTIKAFFKCDDCSSVYSLTDLAISTVRADSKIGSYHINAEGCPTCKGIRATLLSLEDSPKSSVAS